MRHLGLSPPTRCSVAPRRGELGGNRTHDPRIKSALLYRLSYELNFYLIPKYHNEISRYVRELELLRDSILRPEPAQTLGPLRKE
jgi:hypothetical protein